MVSGSRNYKGIPKSSDSELNIPWRKKPMAQQRIYWKSFIIIPVLNNREASSQMATCPGLGNNKIKLNSCRCEKEEQSAGAKVYSGHQNQSVRYNMTDRYNTLLARKLDHSIRKKNPIWLMLSCDQNCYDGV